MPDIKIFRILNRTNLRIFTDTEYFLEIKISTEKDADGNI